MQCKCGSLMTSTSHNVETLACAKKWYSNATQDQLPLYVETDKCKCTRIQYVVSGKDKQVSKKHG